jgi:hypothetical protein
VNLKGALNRSTSSHFLKPWQPAISEQMQPMSDSVVYFHVPALLICFFLLVFFSKTRRMYNNSRRTTSSCVHSTSTPVAKRVLRHLGSYPESWNTITELTGVASFALSLSLALTIPRHASPFQGRNSCTSYCARLLILHNLRKVLERLDD